MLMQKENLPAELAGKIMELADSRPKRILKVPHDPPSSSQQGWQILTNCDMMAKAFGLQLDSYVVELLHVKEFTFSAVKVKGVPGQLALE